MLEIINNGLDVFERGEILLQNGIANRRESRWNVSVYTGKKATFWKGAWYYQ